jgi:hypothetical protein
MVQDRKFLVARMSAEVSASADLGEVCRWLIERRSNPMRLGVDHLPALGQGSRLKLALPITAPRAVLRLVWLLEDVDAGECLLVGQLRFVAHPTESGIRLTFSGRTATAMSPSRVRWPRPGSSSVFSLTTFSRPASSCDSRSTAGATIRQGPHQGAQKSMRTGMAALSTTAWKSAAWVSTSHGRAFPHFPQWGTPSASARTRFF